MPSDKLEIILEKLEKVISLASEQMKPSMLDRFLDIANVIIAFINLVVVVYIFFVEYRERKNQAKSEKEEKQRQDELNRKRDWFHVIVMERMLKVIDDFFLFSNECMKEAEKNLKNQEMFEEYVEQFKNHFYDLKHEVLPALKVFDSKLHKDIGQILQEFETVYTENLEASFQNKYLKYEIRTQPDEYKFRILTKLYTYDIDEEENKKQV